LKYLSIDDISDIYSAAFNISKEAPCIRDKGLLASAAARPDASFGGEDLYKTLAEKAGMLFASLIHNHAFIDGNKRIGFIAMSIMLDLNGYDLKATQDEKYSFVLGAAKGKIKDNEIIDWISSRMLSVASPDLTVVQ